MTEVTLKPQAARTPRDRFIAHLADSKFHSAYELQHLDFLRPGDWYALVGEAIEYGYSFGRRGNSLTMRPRSFGAGTQDIGELLAGIDATAPEDVDHLYDQRLTMVPAPFVPKYGREASSGFEPTEDTSGDLEREPDLPTEPGIVVAGPDRIAISLNPDGCVLSVKASITSTRAILARKSSGKTYLAMVIAEEFLKVRAPFVVIDPTGVWYGLCATVEGTASPYSAVRLGGTHAHFQITHEQGAKVAETVVACWPDSCIIDISDFMPEEQHQFVADFGARLYTINKRAVHLFIDESDEFAPQSVTNSWPNQKRSLGALDRIVRRGRVKGIGVTLITQRPAVIHKNLLSQVDGIFVLNVSAPHDIEAVESWMRPVVSMNMRNDCLANLSKLQRGEAYFMQSGSNVIPLVRFMTKAKTTFDSSKTPTMDEPEPTPTLSSPDPNVLLTVAGILGVRPGDPEPEPEPDFEV